jgi:hypothetical protein
MVYLLILAIIYLIAKPRLNNDKEVLEQPVLQDVYDRSIRIESIIPNVYNTDTTNEFITNGLIRGSKSQIARYIINQCEYLDPHCIFVTNRGCFFISGNNDIYGVTSYTNKDIVTTEAIKSRLRLPKTFKIPSKYFDNNVDTEWVLF